MHRCFAQAVKFSYAEVEQKPHMTEADCQAAAPACTAAAIDHVCRGQPLAVNQRPAIGGQPDDIAATATEERLDDDPEYQWKQYVETHKVPPATDIADYDLLVTHSFHDYVYDNAQRTHMWLYSVQQAKDALVCLINEMSRIKVAAVDTYFERRHMAEQILMIPFVVTTAMTNVTKYFCKTCL